MELNTGIEAEEEGLRNGRNFGRVGNVEYEYPATLTTTCREVDSLRFDVLGHPWGVADAATAGAVIGVGTGFPEIPQSHQEWIAVGLTLRPGHSGGPLVDVQGRLVGINTFRTGPEVGMAVPVHVAKSFLRQKLGPANP